MRKPTNSLGGMMSLVDTLFLLLFTLLAVSETRSSTEAEEVLVALPHVEPDEAVDVPSETLRVAIVVDASSSVSLEGRSEIGSLEQLDRALTERLGDALPEEATVEIRADADARHGVTVLLLQQLRLAGFVDVRLTAIGADEGGDL